MHTQLNNIKQNGFAIIQLLNEEDLKLLLKRCNEIFKDKQQGFYSSSHFLDLQLSIQINDLLHQILKEKIKIIFPNLTLLGGTLATKFKNKSVLKVHQDWTIVDETKYNSYNIWIPLVDVNTNNGTLGLIPGSHKWNSTIRGYDIANPYEKYTNKLIKYGYEPTLKAGEAIIYNHKLLHFSRPNTSREARHVAIIGAIDKQADLQCSILNQNIIETYLMKQADFYLFDVNQIKKNTLLSRTRINTLQVSNKSIITNYYNYIDDSFKLKPTKFSVIDTIKSWFY